MKRAGIIFLFLLITAGGIWFFFSWNQPEQQTLQLSESVSNLLKDETQNQEQQPALEDETPAETDKSVPVEELLPEEKPLNDQTTAVVPAEVYIDVPFIVQAPHANWDMPYAEACEEASVMMVHAYVSELSVQTQDEMKSQIDSIIYWGDETFGAFDTSAAVTTRYFTEKLGYNTDQVHLVYDMTIADIKAVLAQGYPIIVPAAGRELGNKFFQNPGPLYHMLVIVGYDGDEFITNDPGTRRGEDYRYQQEVLYNAIHDLTQDLEQIHTGRKAMIVVKQQ
jgi:hypothetical protein